MYSVLVCSAFALVIGLGGVLLDWWHWIWSIPIALLLFIASGILLVRSLGKRVAPAVVQAQKQAQAGLTDAAIQSFESLLPISKWIPLLRGQLLAQMGALAHRAGDEDRALQLLEGAGLRATEARLLAACIHYKRGDPKRAMDLLQLAVAVNKKDALLHNTYAWMLHKNERSDEAQALLANFLKKDANNAPTKDNLLRLQNRTRMTMQGFDMQWYMLGLEHPPQAMGQVRRAPKGFREPPKRRGG